MKALTTGVKHLANDYVYIPHQPQVKSKTTAPHQL